jgi:surfactin synthase thioesterase subunit
MTDPQTDQTPGGAWETLDQEARDFVLFMIEDGDHEFPHHDGEEVARALRDRVQETLLRNP